MKNAYGDVVLVTGASSGIGRCAAETLAANGLRVYGGSRRGAQGNEAFTMLALDVTDDESVRSFVNEVIEREGRVDILINCAGMGIAGALEDCSGSEALLQLDTNYVGFVRMIGAVLPHMRQARSGLIINVGSIGGIYALPFQSLYCSSKAAVELMTAALRMELKPWGVRTALVDPCDTKTGFTAARVFAAGAAYTDYGQPYRSAVFQMQYDEENGKDPKAVVRQMLRLIASPNPPLRHVVGTAYKLLVFLGRVLPHPVVEAVISAMYTKSKPR